MKKTCFIYRLGLLPHYREEKNWTADARAIVQAHFERLKKATERSQVVLAGRTDYDISIPQNFGIVVFYADDETSARKFMEEDPAIKEGIMEGELFPFSLALIRGAI